VCIFSFASWAAIETFSNRGLRSFFAIRTPFKVGWFVCAAIVSPAARGRRVLSPLKVSDRTNSTQSKRDRDGEPGTGSSPGVGAGQAHGFRVKGPFDPARGLRYNASCGSIHTRAPSSARSGTGPRARPCSRTPARQMHDSARICRAMWWSRRDGPRRLADRSCAVRNDLLRGACAGFTATRPGVLLALRSASRWGRARYPSVFYHADIAAQ